MSEETNQSLRDIGPSKHNKGAEAFEIMPPTVNFNCIAENENLLHNNICHY